MASGEPVCTTLSGDAICYARDLLGQHYIEGGVPDDLVVVLELELKRANAWFPDPQRPWHIEHGYLD